MPELTHGKHRLSAGAIAGLVVGIVAVVVIFIAGIFLYYRRRTTVKSPSHAELTTTNSPIQQHEKIQSTAPQLPNPTLNHLSHKEVERMYLKDSADVGDRKPGTPDTFGSAKDLVRPTGKLAQLTGEMGSQPSSRIAPKGRIQGLKPADERRSVPYRPGDFA
jgi:hypothetical protein